MLVAAVGSYLVCTLLIGVYASRRVKSAWDFMVAGRSLPLYMNIACVFATWFGAETLLSISATFTRDGLTGVSGDPFGATACLVLVGIFFARTFYRMNLLTIGDFFKKRFGRKTEVVTALAIALSYLGWTSAQMSALGLVLYVLGQDTITLNTGIVIGSIIVTSYTLIGGMWSIALTDLIQTVVIIVGLLFVAYGLGIEASGFSNVLRHAEEAGRLRLFPTGGWHDGWLPFISAFLTFALGSIPQQDVFQRVTSARDGRTAVAGTLLGGLFYFAFAFVPMFIAYAAIVIEPSYSTLFSTEDAREVQRILPDLILRRTSLWTQVLFFGALLSAILSTASGTLLAPASLITENIIRPLWRDSSDRRMVWTVRASLVVFSVLATAIALNSRHTMCEMVQSSYKVTLVAAFVPLVFGIYWKRATATGALVSSGSGIGVWLICEWLLELGYSGFFFELLTPQLFGLLSSVLGMVIGSIVTTSEEIVATERTQKKSIRTAESLAA